MTDLPQSARHISQFTRYGALRDNWTHSVGVISDLRDRFADLELPGVLTVAIAGSFARLEGSRLSDADCIIILEGSKDDTPEGQSATEAVEGLITEAGLPKPNPEGTFAQARSFETLLPSLIKGSMGGANEPNDVLAKRMLMLLESRPLWNDAGYEEALAQILARFESYVGDDTSKEHLYLINHLVHYFRFICVNYEANFHRQNDKWPLRNLKLRHSRIVMYMGLLALVGESSKYSDERKLSTVSENLKLTPLERIAYAYEANGDSSFFRVAGLYNTFLARISDEETRTELNDVAYADRYDNVLFSALKANSDALQAELTRFIFARRGQWSERFYEYLLF